MIIFNHNKNNSFLYFVKKKYKKAATNGIIFNGHVELLKGVGKQENIPKTRRIFKFSDFCQSDLV